MTSPTPSFHFTLAAPNSITELDLPRFSATAHTLASCIGETDCTDAYVLNAGSCYNLACGICSCSFQFPGISGTGGWGVTGTNLALTITSSVGCRAGTINCTVRFEYCVQGDVLELRDAEGFRFDMARG